ncbi:MAG: hypothetical protein Kow0069_24990 [Promethearchaeota archaeon]
MLDVTSPGTPGWEVFGSRGRVRLAMGLERNAIPVNALLVKSEFTCFFCNLCVEQCPSAVNVTDVVQGARQEIFSASKTPAPVRRMVDAVDKTGDVFELGGEERLLWGFDVEEALEGRVKRPAEVLYFVGCQGSFKGSLAGTPVGVVTLLERVCADWTVLGDSETCCGTPRYLAGDANWASGTASNVEAIEKLGVEEVIFTCPGCFNTFWRHARAAGSSPPPFKLTFASDFFARALRRGSLSFRAPTEKLGVVAFHDPCELGRHHGVYDSPRELLQAVPGLELRELPNTREMAACCGGGGLVGAAYPEVRDAQAARKVREFVDNGVDLVITACYSCSDALRTASDTARNEGRSAPRVADLFEFLAGLVE